MSKKDKLGYPTNIGVTINTEEDIAIAKYLVQRCAVTGRSFPAELKALARDKMLEEAKVPSKFVNEVYNMIMTKPQYPNEAAEQLWNEVVKQWIKDKKL